LTVRHKWQSIKYSQQSFGYVVLLCEAVTKVTSATASKKRQKKISSYWKLGMGSETRKRNKQVYIRLSEQEYALIAGHASDCSLSIPSFLRALGQGFSPSSTVDSQAITQLAKLHADLGRVGGLLKLWLTNDERKKFGLHLNLPEAMADLKTLRAESADKVKTL